MLSLSQTSAPATEPVTTAELKTHCGIASAETGFDSYVASLGAAAREYIESQLNRQLVTASWTWKLDRFPCGNDPLFMPVAPLASITSIAYVDENGDPQTWASSNYVVSAAREPGRVVPAYSVVWPATRYQPDAVTVVLVTGYGDAAAVPSRYKHLIKLLVAHWFDSRSSVASGSQTVVPQSFVDLLNGSRVGDDYVNYER